MQRHLRNFFVCFALLLMLMAAGLVAPALGQATEGFENGIPASWTVSPPPGLSGTADSTSSLNPTEGTHYGWISTGCGAPTPGTTCPTVATTAESYGSLYAGPGTNGLPGGQGLGTPTVGTTLTSPSYGFSSSGTISFDVNFITTDGTYDFADYAVVTLIPSGDASPVTLFVANTTCSTCAAVPPVGLTGGAATLTPPAASFAGATVTFGSTIYGNVDKFGGGAGGPSAWIHVTYPVSPGSYQLQFQVVHVGDTNYPSALAIDNVKTSQSAVVTPGTTTTFNFQGGVAAGGYDYTVLLNSGSPTNVQLTPIIMTQAQCDTLVQPNFPGAQCFVYQKADGTGTNFAVMFELTCPANPNSACSTFDAELGTDYNFDKTFNPGFNKFDPFPGWLKGEGPDTTHPCTPNTNPINPPLFQSNQIDFFQTVGDPTGTTKGGSGGTGSCWVATYHTPNEVPPGVTISSPTATTYNFNQPLVANYTCSDPTSSKLPEVSNVTGPYLTNVPAGCLGPVPTGTNIDTSAAAIGSHTFTVNAIDTGMNTASKSVSYSVVGYQSSGLCDGDAGHQVLQPINTPPQALSVFKGGRTIPVKFRVCDTNGVSIGTPGVVTSNPFTCTIAGATGSPIDETIIDSNTPDSSFRWDPTGQQWIFNWGTKSLPAGGTVYSCTITLNDTSKILFNLALR